MQNNQFDDEGQRLIELVGQEADKWSDDLFAMVNNDAVRSTSDEWSKCRLDSWCVGQSPWLSGSPSKLEPFLKSAHVVHRNRLVNESIKKLTEWTFHLNRKSNVVDDAFQTASFDLGSNSMAFFFFNCTIHGTLLNIKSHRKIEFHSTLNNTADVQWSNRKPFIQFMNGVISTASVRRRRRRRHESLNKMYSIPCHSASRHNVILVENTFVTTMAIRHTVQLIIISLLRSLSMVMTGDERDTIYGGHWVLLIAFQKWKIFLVKLSMILFDR